MYIRKSSNIYNQTSYVITAVQLLGDTKCINSLALLTFSVRVFFPFFLYNRLLKYFLILSHSERVFFSCFLSCFISSCVPLFAKTPKRMSAIPIDFSVVGILGIRSKQQQTHQSLLHIRKVYLLVIRSSVCFEFHPTDGRMRTACAYINLS